MGAAIGLLLEAIRSSSVTEQLVKSATISETLREQMRP